MTPVAAVLGEALVDVAGGPGTAATVRPGGSPYNVAIGLARLDRATAFVGRLAGDGYGRVLRRHAEASGVDLSRAVDAAEPSTVAQLYLDGDGVAQYEFSATGTADFAWRDDELAGLPFGAAVLHFGSLGSWLPPGAQVVERAMDRLRRTTSTLVSYDPNVRPHLQPDPDVARAQVERSITQADVVKASAEDVDYLYPARELGEVAAYWRGLGPRVVVITRGADGPLASVAAGTVSRAAPPVEVVDTVGAGDAFTSGLLDALIGAGLTTRVSLEKLADPAAFGPLLDHAARVAAITCSRPGADPPRRAEL